MEEKFSFKVLYIAIISLALLFSFINSTSAKNFMPGDDQYVLAADKMPEPVGGPAAIVKKVVYPPIARDTRIEGKVYMMIYINESGNVDDVKIVKGIGAGCDEAAIKAIKETKFSPAMNGNTPVKAKLSFAITFKL